MNKYTVVSLFSGAGGFDLGFKQAGFEIIFANDNFKQAVETYRRNIGNHIVEKDILELKSSEIPDNPDVIIGGFPCQGFSVANTKRSMEDKRNFLYKEMLRIIKDKKPKMFVAENVKGILSMEKGKVIEMIKKDFEDLGYYVETKLFNTAEYEVPQQRERVIIIGNRLRNEVIYPQPTHYIDKPKEGFKPAITVEEVIGYLKDIRCQDEPITLENGKVIYQHQARTNVADTFFARKYEVDQAEICDYLREWRNQKQITTKEIDKKLGYKHTAAHWFRKDKWGSIPTVEDWLQLKKILEFDDKYDEQITTLIEKPVVFEQSLRITKWDKPSATITATNPEIHINKKRRLSVRECAIIQTFPDDFIFSGNSLGMLYKQIGNAVPVKFAYEIAKCIKEELDKDKKQDF